MKDCFVDNKTYPLRFDFYVIQDNGKNYIIEYDGAQHFQSIEWFGGEPGLEKRKIRDAVKNNYCKKNNIPLIRIPYTHLKELTIDDLRPESSQYLV